MVLLLGLLLLRMLGDLCYRCFGRECLSYVSQGGGGGASAGVLLLRVLLLGGGFY